MFPYDRQEVMQIYLAGGAIRDLLLGRTITDRDYLVMNSTRQQFETAFPHAQLVGRAFPVYLLNGLEFSFPRAETLDEELKSRDLTVNALLLNDSGELYCHPNSLDDLIHKRLRPTSKKPFKMIRCVFSEPPDFGPVFRIFHLTRSLSPSCVMSLKRACCKL